MSNYLRRYSIIASVLAAVACSSDSNPADTDASTDPTPADSAVRADREAGSSAEAASDAGSSRDADASSDGRSPDANAEANASADVGPVNAGDAPDADARDDAPTADVASEARVDAETRDAQETGTADGAADAGRDAVAEGSSEASPTDAAADGATNAPVADATPRRDAGACTPPVHPRVTPSSALILDMEGPGLFTQSVPQSIAGNWDPIYPYSENRDAGVHSPWEVSVLSPPRGTSTHGIHSTGSGYPATDANSSGGVGLALLQQFEAPLDSSMYTGVTFWARGSAQTTGLRVFAGLTTVLKTFCLCDDSRPTGGSGCNDVPYFDVPITNGWQQYTVRWAQFRQEGWGDPVPTDPRNLLNFVFRSIPPGPAGSTSTRWDFWLDDTTFATTP